MDRARYAVDAVLIEDRSLRSVASSTGMSKSWVAKQAARFRASGYEALVPLTTAPHRRPTQTSAEPETEIVTMRKHLDEEALDAGPLTHSSKQSAQSALAPKAISKPAPLRAKPTRRMPAHSRA